MVRGFKKENAQKIIDEISRINPKFKAEIRKAGTGRRGDEMNKKIERGTELVKEAVIDLDKEINRVRGDKSSLNLELQNIDQNLENAQQLERRLKEKISRLDNKEAELIDNRKKLKQKSNYLSERLKKLKTIKEQLSEV